MRLAFWQGEFPLTMAASLDTLEVLVRQAKLETADLLVLPELYLGGGYLLNDAAGRALSGTDLNRLKSIAASHKMNVVVGYYERDDDDDDALYNSAMAIDSSGHIVSNYRKSHLFGANEKKTFSPGKKMCQPFDMAGMKVTISICYDVEFPETVRLAALGGAALLLVPTANMHPYDKVNDIVVPVRALENHMFICYCNWGDLVSTEGVRFNGRSSVCGPTGEVLAKFHNNETGLKVVEVSTKDHTNEDEYLQDRRPELYRGIL
eukprot:scaffold1992_cov187-Amphora_coffeaeformis.AAC.20